MRVARLLESENQTREIVIRDRSHHEIHVKSINEALTLSAEMLNQNVLNYECPVNPVYPIRITVVGTMQNIKRH